MSLSPAIRYCPSAALGVGGRKRVHPSHPGSWGPRRATKVPACPCHQRQHHQAVGNEVAKSPPRCSSCWLGNCKLSPSTSRLLSHRAPQHMEREQLKKKVAGRNKPVRGDSTRKLGEGCDEKGAMCTDADAQPSSAL